MSTISRPEIHALMGMLPANCDHLMALQSFPPAASYAGNVERHGVLKNSIAFHIADLDVHVTISAPSAKARAAARPYHRIRYVTKGEAVQTSGGRRSRKQSR